MRLGIRDAVGTVFTALAGLYGIAFLLGAAVPLAPSSRIATLVVLLLGLVACAASGSVQAMTQHLESAAVAVIAVFGMAALVLGVIALIADSTVMLTGLVAVVLAMWALTTLRHALTQERTAPSHRLQAGMAA